MTMRSLPTRLGPVDGEAIDSYFEVLAARLHSTHGDLVDAVGLGANARVQMALAQWIVCLSTAELATVCAATGISTDRLRVMTLSDYDGRGVRVDQTGSRLTSGFPWGYTKGSRYCPHCLAENGGRWLLLWRLGWSFACTTHQCILAHECPKCDDLQRIRVHAAGKVPQPGRCANLASRGAGPRCEADLISAPVLQLAETDPALVAQRAVYTVIDGKRPHPGVYRDTAYSPAQVLSDVRDVAREALTHPDRTALRSLVSDDLLNAFLAAANAEVAGHQQYSSSSEYMRLNSRQSAPRDPVATAAGVAAAWSALGELDVHSVATRLRPLLEGRQRGGVVPSWFLADRNITPGLTAAYICAIRPNSLPILRPAIQSRQRTHTRLLPAIPRAPKRNCDLDRWLPTLLWESWSPRLPLTEHRDRTVRQVLSVAVAIIGTQSSFLDAKQRIGASIKHSTFNRVLDAMRTLNWDETATALERLADHLSIHRAPIDYRRRRGLDYSDLLSEDTWIKLCHRNGVPGLAAYSLAARLELTERLSGMPQHLAGAQPRHFEAIALGRTPSLVRALDRYCLDFLRGQGVRHEPVSWTPNLKAFRH